MSAPMLPPAPGRLSTITCWPSAALIGAATRRAMISPPPPAEDPTMMRIGLVGYACAHAVPTLASTAAIAQIPELSLQNAVNIAESTKLRIVLRQPFSLGLPGCDKTPADLCARAESATVITSRHGSCRATPRYR